jgi:hypothetical protein
MKKLWILGSSLLVAGSTLGAAISVNFHVSDDKDAIKDHILAGSEAAGLDDNTTWNNINIGVSGKHDKPLYPFTATSLQDDIGNKKAATLAATSKSPWFCGYASGPANVAQELQLVGNHDDLFNSYLALNGPSGTGNFEDTARLKISDLSSDYTDKGYKLIIYSDSDKTPASKKEKNTRTSYFKVTAPGRVQTQMIEDDTEARQANTFSGIYFESDNQETGADYANYVVFDNMTASSFEIEVYSDENGGRGVINGFQIVANEGPVVANNGSITKNPVVANNGPVAPDEDLIVATQSTVAPSNAKPESNSTAPQSGMLGGLNLIVAIALLFRKCC